jgi:predicted transglutaminase-like cysteine proteinase
MKFTALMLTIMVAAATTTPASARMHAPAFLGLGPVAAAPAGFDEMCQRDQRLCNLGAQPTRTVQPLQPMQPQLFAIGVDADCTYAAPFFHNPLTPAVFAVPACPVATAPLANPIVPSLVPAIPGVELAKLLKTVNSDVNRIAWQVDDRQAYGVEDRWGRLSTKLKSGDCEDLAIEKRVRLEEVGFPAERMFLALAYKRGLGLHTVLIARLDSGDVVLDSLEPRIRPWSKVRYSWLRVQAPGNSSVWHLVDKGTTAPVQLAAPEPTKTEPVTIGV